MNELVTNSTAAEIESAVDKAFQPAQRPYTRPFPEKPPGVVEIPEFPIDLDAERTDEEDQAALQAKVNEVVNDGFTAAVMQLGQNEFLACLDYALMTNHMTEQVLEIMKPALKEQIKRSGLY